MMEFICTKIKAQEPGFIDNMTEVKAIYNTRNTDLNAIEEKDREFKAMIASASSSYDKVQELDPDPDMF